jgi:hypothetical protein
MSKQLDSWAKKVDALDAVVWPDRKLPVLSAKINNEYVTLARFISVEAKDRFIALAKRGMVFSEEETS